MKKLQVFPTPSPDAHTVNESMPRKIYLKFVLKKLFHMKGSLTCKSVKREIRTHFKHPPFPTLQRSIYHKQKGNTCTFEIEKCIWKMFEVLKEIVEKYFKLSQVVNTKWKWKYKCKAMRCCPAPLMLSVAVEVGINTIWRNSFCHRKSLTIGRSFIMIQGMEKIFNIQVSPRIQVLTKKRWRHF